MFLEGHADQVLRDLETKMQEASDRLEFERAAVLRDQVKAIEQVMESRQIRVSSVKGGDMDVIALAPNSDEALVEVFFVRNGKLMGRDHFVMEGVEETDPSHLMAEFIKQFYTSASYIPQRILLQHPPEERLLLETWLRDKRGATVKLVVPRAGEQRKLVKMVEENATEAVNQKRHKWLSDTSALTQAIEELQEALSLPRLPKRIECYDISNIQGTNPVASMVVFEDGTPKPAYYRRFRIKTVEGIDDFSMMQEVLRRRFKHLASERAKAVSPESLAATDKGSGEDGRGETWGIVPHLVLIDGGKGHLSSALEVFLELGIKDIPLASIAKENEWLFVPQTPEPIILPRTSQALYLVQRVRDEAHRFAITYHRNLRSKSATRSALDVIPGIGPKRKRMLLRRFVSLQGIKEAPVEALAAVPGMTIALAQRLKERL
jgi:excinuclease ABC subunit C